MALTRDFKQTVKTRVERDANFRRELLREAVEGFLKDDVQTGKAVLRDYINATVGFVDLANELGCSPKSLMRMLSPTGNPQVKTVFRIIRLLRESEGVSFQLKVRGAA